MILHRGSTAQSCDQKSIGGVVQQYLGYPQGLPPAWYKDMRGKYVPKTSCGWISTGRPRSKRVTRLSHAVYLGLQTGVGVLRVGIEEGIGYHAISSCPLRNVAEASRCQRTSSPSRDGHRSIHVCSELGRQSEVRQQRALIEKADNLCQGVWGKGAKPPYGP